MMHSKIKSLSLNTSIVRGCFFRHIKDVVEVKSIQLLPWLLSLLAFLRDQLDQEGPRESTKEMQNIIRSRSSEMVHWNQQNDATAPGKKAKRRQVSLKSF